MKSETLEQAAQYYISTEYHDTLKLYPISKHSFIDGAKWQAEQSEHEISEAYQRGLNALIPLIENLQNEVTKLKNNLKKYH